MPRKKTVDLDLLKTFLQKYKTNIVKDSELPVKSDNIWTVISQDLQGKLTPIAIYTIVKKNSYKVWDTLEYVSKNEANALVIKMKLVVLLIVKSIP